MDKKYCFACEKAKGAKLHLWVKTINGCKCKLCGLTADRRDTRKIFGEK